MILFDKNRNKFSATKCKMPYFKSKNNDWDSMIKTIDGIGCKFFFTVRANRSWFYFKYDNQWYKTNMVNKDCIDLYNDVQELFTRTI